MVNCKHIMIDRESLRISSQEHCPHCLTPLSWALACTSWDILYERDETMETEKRCVYDNS